MNILTQITAFLVVVALSSSSVVQSPSAKGDNFELLILHNNDMHARFEQTSQLSGTCTAKDREAGKCYGGFPRVAYVVKQAREAAASGQGPPVLYLNAGDTYTGTAWFTIYKWKIAAEFINALQPDAVSLGNHEFDEEVEGLVPFIHNVTIPVLAANLILDKVPELEHEPNLHKSIILLVQGVKIGVIGYLTPETKYLAPKNKVEYEEEIIAIRREVEALKKQDVKIFIALGHSGFIKDIEIAKNVEDIDLVIGGHSNTFLWNGFTNEKPEYPEGPYPTMVVQPSGRRVPVVQAYAYTKYMGRLHLVFDADGEIVKYDGTPLLLSQDVPNDEELSITIDRYRTEVGRINNEVIGSSLVGLDGICRIKECNMGNFITDAILNYTARYYPDYSDVKIAVVQGGRIRTSIDQAAKPMKILRGDLITVIPFSDTLSIVTMNGTVLKQALEHSVSTWRLIDSTGNFLQMSGIQVTYDLAEPAGSRIIDAKAACSQCGDPSISEVKDDYVYKVFMPSFLADGGDGYVMFENLTKEVISFDELKCLFDYLGKYSPIKPEVSNRITLLNKDKLKSEPHRINNNTNRLLAVPSTILSIVLLCKVLYS
ncbi:protein 5NUC-like [Ostrinia nubilalis]|uniref:protein 5NUC-like n=1 Tax=Ostrinia nubilalis TaxID=29057 RepID=UPI0030825476